MVSGFGIRFRFSGFGFRGSGFDFKVSGFWSLISGFLFLVSGFESSSASPRDASTDGRYSMYETTRC